MENEIAIDEIDVPNDKTKTVTQQEYMRIILSEKVRIVMTQTGYDEKTAISVLQNNGWDCSDAIKRYLSPNKKVVEDKTSSKSVNQKIYGEIRKLMDNASMTYYRNKEYEQLIEQKRQVVQEKKDMLEMTRVDENNVNAEIED